MLNEVLCQIGFTKNEARVYLELLKLGGQPVSIIARKLDLNRTTAYSISKSLLSKGVVSSCLVKSVQYFSANDPNSLVGFLDRRSKFFDYYKSEMLTLIPKFRDTQLDSCSIPQPIVSYYDGIEGVKHVMQDALEAEDEFCSFVSIHKWFDSGLKDFLLNYRNFRITNRKVSLRAIVSDTPEVRAFFKSDNKVFSKLTNILYVSDPRFVKMFENQINIYNDKLAIIGLDKGREYGVIIQSKEIANMHRSIFEMTWAGCKVKC